MNYNSGKSKNSCCCEEEEEWPHIKSYAQYTTYNNSSDSISVEKNANIVFRERKISRGDKIELKSGRIKLKGGSYLIYFLGVAEPVEDNTELAIVKQNTTIAATMNTTSGQISITSIIRIDPAGAYIDIKNLSKRTISFYTTSPNGNIVSPYIIIEEI